jgi:hypothetical protein
MARGWESKSVESQIEDRREAPAPRNETTQETLERTRRRESVESTRRGIVRELQAATSDVRRRSLEAALQHLDGELRKFD